MIVKKEEKDGVKIYYIDKNITDEKMESQTKNKYVKPSQIDFIIDHDADIYSKDGKLIARFRKNKLNKVHCQKFYDNVINFAETPTNNRGSASGSDNKNVRENPKIMTNIIGYFDKFSPIQKYLMKKQGKKINVTVRETRFVMDYPEKFKQLIPLVKEIDRYYEKYIPDNYRKQRSKANQTPFKITGTAFTTITTNVNFQTTVHKDSGDDAEGFGNLAVIEEGKYSGGETCLPQYGIGINVRSGDILFMDVHEWHGNLPIKKETKDAKRLSIVCYLRYNIWQQTKGKTKKFMVQHNKTVKSLRKG